ncbi:hypothetical protein RMR21_000595 [Agrobacterium sp. rho-8.1]|nr:hypothetical protein [Agrobacterium sp. rho-8.1]
MNKNKTAATTIALGHIDGGGSGCSLRAFASPLDLTTTKQEACQLQMSWKSLHIKRFENDKAPA